MDPETIDIVGIIYSKDTADSVYGGVIDRIGINSSVLTSLVSVSGSFVMFHISRGVLIIADEKRNPLHPSEADFSSDTVFHYFSTSKVTELLKIGGGTETSIELRKDVLSITNGNFTLENSKPCPPYCP